jgi:hypothetical protein
MKPQAARPTGKKAKKPGKVSDLPAKSLTEQKTASVKGGGQIPIRLR